MSDNYLRIIPTDPTWLPDSDALPRAAATLSAHVPDADNVETKLHDQVAFIDQGGNFKRLSCPVCHAELSMDWWIERMTLAGAVDFIDLNVTTPCCHEETNLNDLEYDWPAGFARAELAVRNPQRAWLDDEELDQVATQLGHPLRQVMAHY